MKIKYNNLVIIILINPIDLREVSVDSLRRESGFEEVMVDPNGILLVKSPVAENATIQTTRIEFNTGSDKFLKDKEIVNLVSRVIDCLGKISIRSVGTNYFGTLEIEGCKDGGLYIKNKFLRDAKKIESKLGGKIIASATRIFWGTPEKHYDLRLYPDRLGEVGTVRFQFHIHTANKGDLVSIHDFLVKNVEIEPKIFENKITRCLK